MKLLKVLKRKSKRAFTLIELVVVIAVIAILAGVSVAAYFGVTESAKKSAALQEGEQLKTLVTVVANTGDHTVDINGKEPDGEYTLEYNSKGLTVKGVTSEDTLDEVFNAIYYIGTNGEENFNHNNDTKLKGEKAEATLIYYGTKDASGVVVTGFDYTLKSGGTAQITLATSLGSPITWGA